MMILDTNILSALMRSEPDSSVTTWLNTVPPGEVWMNAVSVFEIVSGLEMLEHGKRKSFLKKAFAQCLELLEQRVLPFDMRSAHHAGTLFAACKRKGESMEYRDAQIAGIVLSHNATLVTRNDRHFAGKGVSLLLV